jgi:hypothetical protein
MFFSQLCRRCIFCWKYSRCSLASSDQTHRHPCKNTTANTANNKVQIGLTPASQVPAVAAADATGTLRSKHQLRRRAIAMEASWRRPRPSRSDGREQIWDVLGHRQATRCGDFLHDILLDGMEGVDVDQLSIASEQRALRKAVWKLTELNDSLSAEVEILPSRELQKRTCGSICSPT